MARQIAYWLLSSVVLLFIITVLAFTLVALAPGDAARAILSTQGSNGYTTAQLDAVKKLLGVDQPLPVQYGHWLIGVLHGNLGTDIFSGQPVVSVLASRIGPSLSVVVGTVVVTAVVGIALGIFGARRPGVVGRAVDAISLLGFALPNFWLGLVLIELFAIKLTIFPSVGYTPFAEDPAAWVRSLILPVSTLAVGGVAFVAKQTRDAFSEVLDREYITMLKARGISNRAVLYKHAFRNAAIPVVTVVGLLFVSLLSGTVLIENVFGVPGLGQLAVSATTTHDFPVIEGLALYFTIGVVIVNLLVDLSYRLLNPKVAKGDRD